MDKIHETSAGNVAVELEYVMCDEKRGKSGVLRRCVGKKTKTSHDSRSHGTITLVEEDGTYHTVHVALIMKCNGEFVD